MLTFSLVMHKSNHLTCHQTFQLTCDLAKEKDPVFKILRRKMRNDRMQSISEKQRRSHAEAFLLGRGVSNIPDQLVSADSHSESHNKGGPSIPSTKKLNRQDV